MKSEKIQDASNAKSMIQVKGVTKKFKVYYDKGSSLKERVLFKNRRRHEVHWVLKGIDLEVRKGEAVGLIGKNGCGKSTTLKMLARILYPTQGTITMRGRVSSLIELGAGFHPDMSGRENIFTNASIFGLSRAEIERRMDTIIRFSELEEFIDNPVRTYSSGMYMRLAFAVAINVDADILLIDEILAVGDVGFQEKCFEKLKEIKAKGTTVVIVSHVMGQIEKICDRAIWIEDGRIRKEGTPKDVAAEYLKEMEKVRHERIEADLKKSRAGIQEKEAKARQAQGSGKGQKAALPAFCSGGARREGNQKIVFTDAVMERAYGQPAVFFPVCAKIFIRMRYHAQVTGVPINFTVNIARDDGVYCYGTTALSGTDGAQEILSEKDGEAVMVIESNPLLKGRYLVDIGIQDMQENKYDYIYNAMEFRVEENAFGEIGIVHMAGHWEIG